jgi:hypothetical protein
VDRLTIGMTTDYRPLSWLSANLNVGLDFVDRHDHNGIEAGASPSAASYRLGFRQSQRSNTYLWTGGLSSTAEFA